MSSLLGLTQIGVTPWCGIVARNQQHPRITIEVDAMRDHGGARLGRHLRLSDLRDGVSEGQTGRSAAGGQRYAGRF